MVWKVAVMTRQASEMHEINNDLPANDLQWRTASSNPWIGFNKRWTSSGLLNFSSAESTGWYSPRIKRQNTLKLHDSNKAPMSMTDCKIWKLWSIQKWWQKMAYRRVGTISVDQVLGQRVVVARKHHHRLKTEIIWHEFWLTLSKMSRVNSSL